MAIATVPSPSRSLPRHRRRGLPPAREGTLQLALFVGAYAVYGLARWIATPHLGPAVAHAHWVVDVERSTGVHVERSLQRAFRADTWVDAFNGVYFAAQYLVLPGALVWLHRRDRPGYRRLRDTVLATWLLAVPVYAAFPVAPPRLASIGIADTISAHTGLTLDGRLATSLYNPLAAVPSLHAGFALAVGLALAASVRHGWAKALWLAWPAAVALAVVITGNHFLFDIAAGFAVTALGFALARGRAQARGRRSLMTPSTPASRTRRSVRGSSTVQA